MSAPRLPVRAFIPLCAGVLAAWLVMARPAQAGYRIENVTYPSEIRGGISAVTFTPAGTLVIATRYGEVWMRSTSGPTLSSSLKMGTTSDSSSGAVASITPESDSAVVCNTYFS